MVLHSSAHWDDNPELKYITNDYTKPFDSRTGTALEGIWRDTAIIPPYGYLVIKHCYDAGIHPSLEEEFQTFGGKFVFHCHFLTHEDTGLMRNVILSSNKTVVSAVSKRSGGPIGFDSNESTSGVSHRLGVSHPLVVGFLLVATGAALLCPV